MKQTGKIMNACACAHTHTDTFYLSLTSKTLMFNAQLINFLILWLKYLESNLHFNDVRKSHMDDEGSVRALLKSSCSGWLNLCS